MAMEEKTSCFQGIPSGGTVISQTSYSPEIGVLIDAIGWTDTAAAAHVGVHRNMIGRWRKEGAPLDVIIYLQNVLVAIHSVRPARARVG